MINIDGHSLSIADIVAVARHGESVALDERVAPRVARARELSQLVATRRPVYGQSTGVGANKTVPVSDLAEHSLRLLRSHATAAGVLRDEERVRGMLVVRLSQLAAGGNGIQIEALRGMVEMLDHNQLPPVRTWGGLGTGDLAALATTGLALAGEVDRVYLDQTWTPFGDALTFISSNAATLADAGLALWDLHRLGHRALPIAALSFAAVHGNAEAFARAVERATPFPGAAAVCRVMRHLVAGSDVPTRIQDPFGLRTMPQVHGPLLDELAATEAVVGALCNSPSENPMMYGEEADVDVVHHGSFHMEYLAQAIDGLRLALAGAMQASLARTTMLSEPDFTGAAAFLADDTPGASGTMVVEYAAAAALAEVRTLATPATLQTVTVSRGVEEDASFASQAAEWALDSVAASRAILAAELMCAHRALSLGHATVPPALEPLVEALSDAGLGAGGLTDRDLSEDLALAETLLDHEAFDILLPDEPFVPPPILG